MIGRQAIRELEAMAHLQAVHEDVHRSPVAQVREIELLVAVEGVVLLVRHVPGCREQIRHGALVATPGGEIDVPAVPADPGRPGGHQGVECQAAHEPDLETARIGQADQPERLSQRVLERRRRLPAGIAR